MLNFELKKDAENFLEEINESKRRKRNAELSKTIKDTGEINKKRLENNNPENELINFKELINLIGEMWRKHLEQEKTIKEQEKTIKELKEELELSKEEVQQLRNYRKDIKIQYTPEVKKAMAVFGRSSR